MSHYSIKISRTPGKWEKHEYINQSRHDVILIDSHDCNTHLTIITAGSTIPPRKQAQRSRTIVITDRDVIIDARGNKWIFSPEE